MCKPLHLLNTVHMQVLVQYSHHYQLSMVQDHRCHHPLSQIQDSHQALSNKRQATVPLSSQAKDSHHVLSNKQQATVPLSNWVHLFTSNFLLV